MYYILYNILYIVLNIVYYILYTIPYNVLYIIYYILYWVLKTLARVDTLWVTRVQLARSWSTSVFPLLFSYRSPRRLLPGVVSTSSQPAASLQRSASRLPFLWCSSPLSGVELSYLRTNISLRRETAAGTHGFFSRTELFPSLRARSISPGPASSFREYFSLDETSCPSKVCRAVQIDSRDWPIDQFTWMWKKKGNSIKENDVKLGERGIKIKMIF